MESILKNLSIHDNKRTKELLEKARSKNWNTCVWGAGEIGTGFGKQILDEYGIKIDYYCDNRVELIDTEVVSGIYCKKKDILIKCTEKTICFVLIGYANIGSVYKQLIEDGVKYIVTYDDLLAIPETLKKHLPYLNRKDTAIYTCITGDYDSVREPRYISERCDYFLVSDKKGNENSVYQFIDINKFLPQNITNPIYQNRYCKINAHKLFPQYRYSVYVDGNITITGDIAENIHKLKKSRIGVLGENYTDNIYEYAYRCACIGGDLPEKIVHQMEAYWLKGLPENSGSFACGILVREHNNPICVNLMEEWWDEFCKYAQRDQTPFSYVLWKNGFSKEDVLLLCDSKKYDAWGRTPYWEYDVNHKKDRFKIDCCIKL